MKIHKILAALTITLIVTVFLACSNQKSEKKETNETTDTTEVTKMKDTNPPGDHTVTNDNTSPKVNAETKDNVATNDRPDQKIGGYSYSYSFVDASVPPQYHRSYTIKVTPSQVILTVTSYGDVLLNESSPISTSAYDNFADGIVKLNIRNKKGADNAGCTGGKTDKLELYIGSPQQVQGSIYHCGGADYGDLEGNVSAAVQLFKGLVPNLTKKIDGTRKN